MWFTVGGKQGQDVPGLPDLHVQHCGFLETEVNLSAVHCGILHYAARLLYNRSEFFLLCAGADSIRGRESE